jgi:hypothetical protein
VLIRVIRVIRVIRAPQEAEGLFSGEFNLIIREKESNIPVDKSSGDCLLYYWDRPILFAG